MSSAGGRGGGAVGRPRAGERAPGLGSGLRGGRGSPGPPLGWGRGAVWASAASLVPAGWRATGRAPRRSRPAAGPSSLCFSGCRRGPREEAAALARCARPRCRLCPAATPRREPECRERGGPRGVNQRGAGAGEFGPEACAVDGRCCAGGLGVRGFSPGAAKNIPFYGSSQQGAFPGAVSQPWCHCPAVLPHKAGRKGRRKFSRVNGGN